jgi:hypothetical protein
VALKDPGKIVTSVYLPRALRERLRAAAANERRSMSGQMTVVLERWLETRADSAAQEREKK